MRQLEKTVSWPVLACFLCSVNLSYGIWEFEVGPDDFAELMLETQADNLRQRMAVFKGKRYHKQVFFNGAALYQYNRFSPEGSRREDSSYATFDLGFNVMIDRNWLGYSQLNVNHRWPKPKDGVTTDPSDKTFDLKQSYIAYQKPGWNMYALTGVAPVSYGLFESAIYGEESLISTLFQVKNSPQLALIYDDGVSFITATGYQVTDEGDTETHSRYALSTGFSEKIMGMPIETGLGYLSAKSFKQGENKLGAAKTYGGYLNVGFEFGSSMLRFINEYHQSHEVIGGKVKAYRNRIMYASQMLGCQSLTTTLSRGVVQVDAQSIARKSISLSCLFNSAMKLGAQYANVYGDASVAGFSSGKSLSVQLALIF